MYVDSSGISVGLSSWGYHNFLWDPRDQRVTPDTYVFVTTEAYVTTLISDIWAYGAINLMYRCSVK